MRAYVLNGIGKLDLMEVAKPVLKAGKVLVEVKAAGVCGSDIPRIFVNGTYHFPTIPGHEFSGVVREVYDETMRKLVGKRVGVFPLIPCLECVPCKEKNMKCVCTMIILDQGEMADLQNLLQFRQEILLNCQTRFLLKQQPCWNRQA